MVIDDLDLVGVARPKLEANPPGPVHRHRPLAGPSPLELVQPDALERAQVAERGGGVERQQQVNGGGVVQAAKPPRRCAFPDPSAGCVAPRADHGKYILRQPVSNNASSNARPDARGARWRAAPLFAAFKARGHVEGHLREGSAQSASADGPIDG